MYVCIHIHIYIYTYTHRCIYVCVHIYIYSISIYVCQRAAGHSELPSGNGSRLMYDIHAYQMRADMHLQSVPHRREDVDAGPDVGAHRVNADEDSDGATDGDG